MTTNPEPSVAGHNKAMPAWTVLWPVFAVATVLLLAATVPVPSVPVTLEVQASSITLTLPAASRLGALATGDRLQIEGFTSLKSGDPQLAGSGAAAHVDNLIVHSEQTWLRALHLPAGSELTVQARGKATALGIESPRSPVVADVEMRGKTTLRLGDRDEVLSRVFIHSEWLTVAGGDATRADQKAPPMTLTLARQGDTALEIKGLRPSELAFRERREGSGVESVVVSSLEGGTLSVPSTGLSLRINGGDWLQIEGLLVERCEILAGAVLALKLNGSARVVRLRVGEFEKSLKPSWLEFVSRHHLVNLLWGSAALLWGALAWIRKYFATVPP